jgi:hypothetical protein
MTVSIGDDDAAENGREWLGWWWLVWGQSQVKAQSSGRQLELRRCGRPARVTPKASTVAERVGVAPAEMREARQRSRSHASAPDAINYDA